MSVNSKMVETKVFKLQEIESPSGAKKSSWIELKDSIYMSIYQSSQFVSKDRYRHTDTTHSAVTHCRYLKANKFRLIQNGVKFEILDVDNSHRLSQLSLKEVEIW